MLFPISALSRDHRTGPRRSHVPKCVERWKMTCLFYLLLFYNFYNNMNLLINNKVGSEWSITTYRESGTDMVLIPQNYYHLLGFRNMMFWNVFLPIYDVLEWITTIVWWFGIFMFITTFWCFGMYSYHVWCFKMYSNHFWCFDII